MMAALDRLSDSFPVEVNPQVIVKDMYVIIIYDSISPQTFNGQVVFADIGAEFTTDAFQMSHISLNSFDGDPTASIGLPHSLLDKRTGDHRIVFNFFLNDGFFIRRDSYITENNLQNDKLGGLAVAAHIAGGVKVTNLINPVNMTFTINPVSKILWLKFLFFLEFCCEKVCKEFTDVTFLRLDTDRFISHSYLGGNCTV